LSIAWACLDTAYYALIGASASKIATKVFDVLPVEYNCTSIPGLMLGSAPNCTLLNLDATNPHPQSIYGSVFDNLWRVIILVSAGSIPAGLGMIYLVKTYSLRRIQLIGFVVLGFILIIIGAILRHIHVSSVTAATIPFYLLAQVFFEIGPNFTTWMLSAELFPTRHRAFSHGIAAASGKAGAVLFLVFFQSAKFPGGLGVDKPGTKWLGLAIICFMPFMFVGAFVTWAWVPETRDEEGYDRGLEELEDLTRDLRPENVGVENPQPHVAMVDQSV
jgi:PHS family inorganic phosphate transporter-like MFS transporter